MKWFSFLLFLLTGCVQPNALTKTEKAQGWERLFDGKTTRGWRGAYQTGFPDHGWVVQHGELRGQLDKGGVADSKFKDYPGFARIPEGHILLQDHGHNVAFKNIKIRTL